MDLKTNPHVFCSEACAQAMECQFDDCPFACRCPVDSDCMGYAYTWGWKKEDCPIHGDKK